MANPPFNNPPKSLKQQQQQQQQQKNITTSMTHLPMSSVLVSQARLSESGLRESRAR